MNEEKKKLLKDNVEKELDLMSYNSLVKSTIKSLVDLERKVEELKYSFRLTNQTVNFLKKSIFKNQIRIENWMVKAYSKAKLPKSEREELIEKVRNEFKKVFLDWNGAEIPEELDEFLEKLKWKEK